MMSQKDEAKTLYESGAKYKDISDKLDVPINTLKSWRKRDGWQRDKKGVQPSKKVAPKVAPKKETEKAVEELANSELTDKQKAFVMEYVRLANATQAYINVYAVDYKTAVVAGPRMLGNVRVQSAIKELREAKFKELAISEFDLIEQLAKEANADVGDFVDFGAYREQLQYMDGDDQLRDRYDDDNKPMYRHTSWVAFKDKDKVDTSVIKKISLGKDGPNLELYDRDKARKQLLDWFKDSNQMELAKLRKAKAEADIAEHKAKDITNTDDEQTQTLIVDDLEGKNGE